MRIEEGTKKNLKVGLSLSRDSNGNWNLQVEDQASSLIVIDIRMDNKQFSDFMANTHTAGKAEYYANPIIGKKMEHKRYYVDLDDTFFEGFDAKKRERDMRHVLDLAEEKNPGWRVDREDYNSKRHSYTHKTYEVTLRRYV